MSGELTIENLALTGNFDRELDLESLDEDLDGGAHYDPEHFHALIYRDDASDGTMNVFRTGKCVITGVDNQTAAENLLDTFLDDLDADIDRPDLTVTNIVGAGEVGTPLNLVTAVIGLGLENAEYEPEQFPALVYKPPTEIATILLFSSGKLVVTGARTLAAAVAAFNSILSNLDANGLLGDPAAVHAAD